MAALLIWFHETSLSAHLMRAEKRHYASGASQCLSFGNITGIKLNATWNTTAWFPRNDLTAPTAHPFIFYAGAQENTPDLAIDLERRGLLTRHDLTMTTEVVTDEIGLQARTAGGAYYHPETIRHALRTTPVVFYTVKRNDPRFTYDLRFRQALVFGGGNLSTRVYDTPLPETGRYSVPVVSPYMMSLVSGACLTMRRRSITAIERRTDPLTGDHFYSATVVFSVDRPPSWMDTPVFRRASGSSSLLAPGSTVERTTFFKDDHGFMVFQADSSL